MVARARLANTLTFACTSSLLACLCVALSHANCLSQLFCSVSSFVVGLVIAAAVTRLRQGRNGCFFGRSDLFAHWANLKGIAHSGAHTV